MKENELYAPLTKGALLDGWLLIKIVDGSVGKKPFDIFGITSTGKAIAIEVKVWRYNSVPVTLPEKIFESQQLPYLREYASRGGIALAIIYHETLKRMMVWSFNHNCWMPDLVKKDSNWRGWPNGISHYELRRSMAGRLDPA